MFNKKIKFFLGVIFLFFLFNSIAIFSADWPIFKGNIYFTGNNDEIIVKNNNLKWLFQADSHTFNPVISDGYVYFVDQKGQLYCVDEEFGKLKWKVDVRKIAMRFKTLNRAAGKVKYPLVQGDKVFLTDPIAIYAFDKNSGKPIWARTALRTETEKIGLSGPRMKTMIDGIYSDPIINDNKIFYGTRLTFMSREIQNGHLMWDNQDIGSYSGFPTFYDEYVITQSMDYSKGIYSIYCLSQVSGKTLWVKNIAKPFKIFPPVVYKQKVFIPTGESLYALNIKNGELLWTKNYGGIISSIPGYTDRAIIFVLNNKDVYVVSPGNGELLKKVEMHDKAGPRFVTIRDQIYLSYNVEAVYGGKNVNYGVLKAVNFDNGKTLWSFRTPFPGSVSQPAANGGIMFMPSGNYLYAVGTEYYAKIIDGGSGHAAAPGSKGENVPPPVRPDLNQKNQLKMRDMEITIKNKEGLDVPSVVEITKRDKGRIIYSKKIAVNKPGKIKVPDGDNVEVVASARSYVPKKVVVNNDDKKKEITLDKIERGKSYIVDNINFEFNQAYLKKESLDIISNLVDMMKRDKSLKVEVRGYTDSVGDKSYNLKLSERRADAVRDYMVKQGISPERVSSVGFGEKNPVDSNKTETGRAKNRRTEFYFEK